MRAPSLVAKLKTSTTLPLLRFTSTYEALVSTVWADAVAAANARAISANFARARARTVETIRTSMFFPLPCGTALPRP